MLRTSLLLWGLFGTSVIFARNFLAVVLIETASGVSTSPTAGLINTCIIKAYGSKLYTVQRTWGAVGGAVFGLASGFVAGTKAGFTGVIVMIAGLIIIVILSVGLLPEDNMHYHHQPNSEKQDRATELSGEGTAVAGDTSVISAIRLILGSPQIASFYASSFLSGAGKVIIDTFLFIRIAELGGLGMVMGFAKLMMYVGELPCMYFSGLLIEKAGFRGAMALTEVAFIIRFTYYSQLRNPWMILPVELLHGLTYALMWSVTVQYADHIAPSHLKATMQGLTCSIVKGLGGGFGAILGGFLYYKVGASLLFAYSAILPSVALLLLIGDERVDVQEDCERAEEYSAHATSESTQFSNKMVVEQELTLLAE
ncbi:unnamed protein product [Choristocarpus tenellus]